MILILDIVNITDDVYRKIILEYKYEFQIHPFQIEFSTIINCLVFLCVLHCSLIYGFRFVSKYFIPIEELSLREPRMYTFIYI